jgi:uncharacterized protein YggL (DUF469 family)
MFFALGGKKMNKLLDELIKPQGFKKSGSAYFRIQGENVLQIIKFEKERAQQTQGTVL